MTLMIMALGRDMRGVESQILPQLESFDIYSAKNALANEIAIAFSRFLYPESFFSWTADSTRDGILYVFNRTDRLPSWHPDRTEGARFPVAILENPGEIRPLVQTIRDRSSLLTPVSVFETRIGGKVYQVIARLRYGGPSDTSLQSVIGFTVDIDWVRVHYFSELTSQLSRILAGQTNTFLTVLDENGAVVSSSGPRASVQSGPRPALHEERFPLLFFEPSFKAAAPDGALHERYWTARAEAIVDDSMLPAVGGARRMFFLISAATVVAGIALMLTIRALRASALLAAMKSEFVSAVTHELKTPLSSIQLACETLVKGRVSSEDATTEYAPLLLNAVSRLNRTVDNLLSTARVHDVKAFYHFETLDLVMVLEQVLDRFQPLLRSHGFEVEMDVPAFLPPVSADRTAILQVFDNLLDNAVRYSNGTRYLKISASASAGNVAVQITDRGLGIPPEELPHVFEKFFRGRNAPSTGSGLGLAIAQRVIKDHGGAIRLNSTNGSGTTAEIWLRSMANEESDNEAANFSS
jgi:signal transduction histidine kinase